MPVTETRTAIGPRAMEIFREKIRPQLTEADKGKYIVVDTITEKWVMHLDKDEVERLATAQIGNGPHQLLFRAGYRASASFRPGLNLELPEW